MINICTGDTLISHSAKRLISYVWYKSDLHLKMAQKPRVIHWLALNTESLSPSVETKNEKHLKPLTGEANNIHSFVMMPPVNGCHLLGGIWMVSSQSWCLGSRKNLQESKQGLWQGSNCDVQNSRTYGAVQWLVHTNSALRKVNRWTRDRKPKVYQEQNRVCTEHRLTKSGQMKIRLNIIACSNESHTDGRVRIWQFL